MADATGSILTLHSPLLLASQEVSDLMAGAPGSVLTVLSPTLVLLT